MEYTGVSYSGTKCAFVVLSDSSHEYGITVKIKVFYIS
jgi:hypothetical protein